MQIFSDIVEINGKNESVHGKIVSDGKETSEKINDTESAADDVPVENRLNMDRTTSNKKTLFSKKRSINSGFKW